LEQMLPDSQSLLRQETLKTIKNVKKIQSNKKTKMMWDERVEKPSPLRISQSLLFITCLE
jgi:hypothetical protein